MYFSQETCIQSGQEHSYLKRKCTSVGKRYLIVKISGRYFKKRADVYMYVEQQGMYFIDIGRLFFVEK